MAKKGKRPQFPLICTECKKVGKTRRNYITTKNVINDPEKLKLNKYCSFCKKHTEHLEGKLPPSKKR